MDWVWEGKKGEELEKMSVDNFFKSFVVKGSRDVGWKLEGEMGLREGFFWIRDIIVCLYVDGKD